MTDQFKKAIIKEFGSMKAFRLEREWNEIVELGRGLGKTEYELDQARILFDEMNVPEVLPQHLGIKE